VVLRKSLKVLHRTTLVAVIGLALSPSATLVAGTAEKNDRDPLIQVLIEKGILTEEEARDIEAEVARRKARKPQERELSLGDKIQVKGQYRFRVEGRENRDFRNAVGDRKSSAMQRTRLGLSLETDDDNEILLQLQDSRVWGSEVSTTTSGLFTPANGVANTTALDLHQAFWKADNVGGKPVSTRIGRQELSFGDERVIGAFGWDNVGRSFDGAKLTFKGDGFVADAFLSHVVESNSILALAPGPDDDDLYFGGVYATWPRHRGGVTDSYALLKRDGRGASYVANATVGIRRKAPFGEHADYSFEGAYQFGGVVAGDQSAYAFVAGTGYNVPHNRHGLRFALEYALASGDESAGDGNSETFDQLFPTNHDKYGYMDYQGWRNMRDLRLTASAKPRNKLGVAVDFHWFRLDEARDAWYGAGGAPNLTAEGTPFIDVTGASGRSVGKEIDFSLNCAVSDRVKLLAGYSRFFPGDFVEAVNGGAGSSSEWFFLQSQYGID